MPNPYLDIVEKNPYLDTVEKNPYLDLVEKDGLFMKSVKGAAKSVKENVIDPVLAPLEAGASIGSGMAGASASGVVGLPLELANKMIEWRYGEAAKNSMGYDSVGIMEDIQESATYGVGWGRKTTEEADVLLRAVNYPMEKWSENVAKPAGRTAQDLGAWPSLAAAIETAVEFAPWILLPGAYKRGRYGATKAERQATMLKEAELDARIGQGEAIEPPVDKRLPKVLEDAKAVVAPIGTGSPLAQAVVKNYTNSLATIDNILRVQFAKATKKFKRPEQRAMYDAAIADEAAIRNGETPTAIDSLPLEMRDHARSVQAIHKGIEAEAIKVGILPPAPIEGWVPRTVVRELGLEEAVFGKKAVKTSTPRARKRKYETVEETEAAAKERLGDESYVSKDLREYHLVDAELMRAIAGKKLITEVRRLGNEIGEDTVRYWDGKTENGYFTMEHPAFVESRPEIKLRPEGDVGARGGKTKIRLDEEGEIVWNRKPLQISKEFEGPLRAALEGNPSGLYRAIMKLKSGAMQSIMISPMMHGMVIWGKALPYQPIRSMTFRNYRDGHRIENITKNPAKESKNNEWLRDQISDLNLPRKYQFETGLEYQEFMTRTGHRPIGDMGWMQRMSDAMQSPKLEPGRSFISKMVGYPAGLFGKGAKSAAMRGVDAAGHFWHDTLLWDQVRASGFGMHLNIFRKLVKKGVDPEVAGYVASHMSNRFTGSIPFEDISAGARAAMNVSLFSKSFTGTNVGLYVDALRGLPRAVQSQIIRNMRDTVGDSSAANSAIRTAAVATLAKDIVGMYVLNAMLQSTIRVWQDSLDIELDGLLDGLGGKEVINLDRDALKAAVSDEIQLYKNAAERWNDLNEGVVAKVAHYDELSPLALNDPGKEHRVRMGTTPEGTAEYVRSPVGKVGEDLEKSFKSPFELLMNKLSPTLSFGIALALNDKSKDRGYGIDVFNADGTLIEKIGQTVHFFIESHTAWDAYERAKEYFIDGDVREGKELLAQLSIGLSFSEGAPGGPALGKWWEVNEKAQNKLRRAGRNARELIDDGDLVGALTVLVVDAQMNKDRAIAYIQNRLAPQAKLNEARIEEFYIHADEKDKAEIEAIINKEFSN